MRKKSLLFVIDSLDCAGAEKSLVTLLSLLDYTKYSVDLMLFAHGTLLEALVPKEVNILRPLKYTKFTELSLNKALLHSIRHFNYKMIYSRIKYSYKIRTEVYKDENIQRARLFWENVSSVIEENPKEYDIAISYAQGIPTFYVAEKVIAKKKISWVNVSYRLEGKERGFQKNYYDQIDKIVAVSDSTKDVFLETYPIYTDKVEVIYDITNPELIVKMANLETDNEFQFEGIKILTIGRLNFQKGYDIALEACKKLKERGINFRWYVLGKGPLEEEIKQYINKNNLTDYFFLLGVKANPYPYIKNCDIYVQTSKFEGFGLAIAEARMLNKPVVTTKFDAVFNQMIHEKNGLVVDMNSDAVCKGIIKFINDQKLREKVRHYLENEKKGNVEEIERFYQLIE